MNLEELAQEVTDAAAKRALNMVQMALAVLGMPLSSVTENEQMALESGIYGGIAATIEELGIRGMLGWPE